MTANATTEYRTPRLALSMLIVLGVVLAIFTPQRDWAVVGVVAGTIAYLLWRFHGLGSAAVGVVLALVHLAAIPTWPEAGLTCCTLLLLTGSVAGWSVAARRGRGSWFAVGLCLAGGVAFLLWRQTQPLDDLQVRWLQANALLLVVAGVGGSVLLARPIGGRQTLLLFGTTVGGPALAVGAVYYAGSVAPEMLNLHAWTDHGGTLATWAQRAVSQSEPWCWATAWVILPLMLLGWWQAWSRGRKQRRRGEAPLGWLFGGGAVLIFVAVLPHDLFVLHLEAILLPLFGVADATLALVERIQLEPPGSA